MLEFPNGEKVEELISEAAIKVRIKEIATQIKTDYENKPIMLLCTLKGAIFLLADLARELPPNVEIDFVKASSYGSKTQSDGVIELEHFPGTNLPGKNIIIIEDIIDSGHTLKSLCKYIKEQAPASLKVCSLLDKPERREVKNLTCDYLGFTIPDDFVVGYGLDYAQRYRNLPFIGILHQPQK